jgi:hypothetical protein
MADVLRTLEKVEKRNQLEIFSDLRDHGVTLG